MGILGVVGELLNTLAGDDDKYPTCDACGEKMTEFDGVDWYTCPSCGNMLKAMDDGELVNFNDLRSGSSSRVCISCGQSLSGGEHTSPWEDGGNEYGYVICPHCRCKNIIYD